MRCLALIGALVAVALPASGCGSSSHSTQTQPPIAQLHSIDQLRHTFDAHPGEPRLILLISPT
jgi:hypothetical protein